ncbi:hypothetical protein GJ631_04705 [Natronomonas sp. CBA1123]|jgi:hypothetical protein|uniref:hypothetical protein n=1 Tax=Natronomonas sp. CBA1123 TaxID=2668070 RepID=UPI0012EAD9BE|nr:hypothetical protein [Natronomonas sp. CBA1123]MUV85889.1 hypothetical protein [Natronomonas sp. CBA1123]
MSDARELFEELQAQMEDTGQTLGDLLQQAVEDPSSAPDIAVELLEEAANTGQSVGELLQDAVESSDEIAGEFTDGNFLVDFGEDTLSMDFDNDLLLVDPSDEEFAELLRQFDVFGVGEQFGFIPPADEE